jgi:hypothetical protein
MSTACRLFLNAAGFRRAASRKVSPLTSKKKEHKNGFEQSAGEGASAAEQRLGETRGLRRHWHGFKLASLRQTLGLLGEFLKGCCRPA